MNRRRLKPNKYLNGRKVELLDKVVDGSRVGYSSLLARKSELVPTERSLVRLRVVLVRQVIEIHVRVHNFHVSMQLKQIVKNNNRLKI